MHTIVLHSVDSTNTYAKRLLQEGGYDLPLCVAALQQTAGKGRYSREWSSLPGGVYFSIAQKISGNTKENAAYPLYIASIVHHWLKTTLRISDLFIKWPNDMYINMRKLSGILSTMQTCGSESIIITGVGINVRNDIPDTAVSLRQLFPEKTFNIHTILHDIVQEIHTHSFDHEQVRTYINSYLWGKNQTRKLIIHGEEIKGIIREVADDFSLVLERDDDKKLCRYSLGELE